MITGRSFRDVFGIDSVVSARAPGRVNLLGDHTDYNDGFVLPTAIPQQTVVEAAPGNGMHEVYSATLDRMARFDTATDRFRPLCRWLRRVLERRGARIPALRLRIASDVPVGAGLSSSAAVEVATSARARRLLGLGLDPEEVAHLAHRAEVEFAGRLLRDHGPDGVQPGADGPHAVSRHDDPGTGAAAVATADSEVLVMHSGVPRSLAGSDYNRRRAECEAAAAMLGVRSLRMVDDLIAVDRLPSPLRERARHVITENRRVLAARNADAAAFRSLMTQSPARSRTFTRSHFPRWMHWWRRCSR